MGRKEREEKAGEGTISRSRGPATAERRSDLIGCGSDSLNSSTTFQRARARGRARASTRQDTDASRGKGAFARLLSSLPHYSIMMACGVCRTPFALIAPAPSPLPASSRAHPPVSPPHTLSPSPPKPIPPLFSLSTSLFHVPLYLSSAFHEQRERERDVRGDAYAHVSFLLVRRECLRWSLDPGSSTRTHRRDDDVRDITPAGERGSPKVRRGGSAGERRGEKERKVR